MSQSNHTTAIQNADQALPMWKIVWNQFKSHRAAVVSTGLIAILVSIALSADLISEFTHRDPYTQNVFNRYSAPMTIADLSPEVREKKWSEWAQHNSELAQKFIQLSILKGTVSSSESASQEISGKTIAESIEVIQELTDSAALTQLESSTLKTAMLSWRVKHWLGTDELGRDVFIRMIYGTRVSLGIAFLVAISAAMIGMLVGSISGYYGGLIDSVLMRITDSLLSLPLVPLLILLAAVDLNKVPVVNALIPVRFESIAKICLILFLTSWMHVALLVRGSILSLREREFILAAKTLGAKDSFIILRHILPNVLAPMLVSISLGIGESIQYEAALSFLGLGTTPPTPSWGNMLNNAQELIYQAPFLAILPGLMIFFTTISFNFVGDGLQDAIDPKGIRR